VSAIETLLWRARQSLKREFEALGDSTTALGTSGVLRPRVG